MYAIVVQGEIIAMQDSPRYIKIDPVTETYIECSREEAIGIAANGVAYNVYGGTAIPDSPVAEAKEIESGEVMIQTENNRKALNVMLGVQDAEIPQGEELSYADKLMHSYVESEEDAKALEGVRGSLDNLVVKIVDIPAEINQNMAAIRKWEPGIYSVDDVRMHDGIPHRCKQGHDSTANPGWTPAAEKALWGHYHGTTPETARPFEADSANMYQLGEYCTENGKIYLNHYPDNVYAPSVLPERWEFVRTTE